MKRTLIIIVITLLKVCIPSYSFIYHRRFNNYECPIFKRMSPKISLSAFQISPEKRTGNNQEEPITVVPLSIKTFSKLYKNIKNEFPIEFCVDIGVAGSLQHKNSPKSLKRQNYRYFSRIYPPLKKTLLYDHVVDIKRNINAETETTFQMEIRNTISNTSVVRYILIPTQ